GGDATGKITFTLFSVVLNGKEEPVCGEKAKSNNVSEKNPQEAEVKGDGEYKAAGFTPNAAGKYVWVAEYSGDSPNTNKAGPSACSDANETVTVKPSTPELGPPADASAIVGQKISDTATLSGLVNPVSPFGSV